MVRPILNVFDDIQDRFGAENLSPDLQNFRGMLAEYYTNLIPMMNSNSFRQLFPKLQREMDEANDYNRGSSSHNDIEAITGEPSSTTDNKRLIGNNNN